MAETVAALLDRALAAYERLEELGETIDDEWSYVTDLHAAWQAKLADLAAGSGAEAATDRQAAAIDRLIDEVGRIGDPHRAIDWLSTFPQAVLLAVGDRRP